MNTHILNRAILNRDALDDNQRKAMFARLGGHGGGTAYGGSARKAADQRQKDRMAKAWKMGFGLGQSMVGGIGVAAEAKLAGAVDDLAWSAIFRRHAAQPASRATVGVLDDVARDMDQMTPLQFERAYPRVGGKYDAATQARRNDLAAQLRRDRELKRLDMHPEKFFTTGDAELDAAARLTPDAPASSLGYFSSKSVGELARSLRQESAAYQKAKADAAAHAASKKKLFRQGETLALYGNRMPPARTDEERRRRAFFASKGDGYASRARGLLDHAGTVARKAISATRTSVLRGPNDRNPQPANGFLDWALREQRPGGPVIQDNPRNPYDTPGQRAQILADQYAAEMRTTPPGASQPSGPSQGSQFHVGKGVHDIDTFHQLYPRAGSLLGEAHIRSLMADPTDSNALNALASELSMVLSRADWTRDTTALTDIEVWRRTGMANALSILHSYGLMREYTMQSRVNGGGMNFFRTSTGLPGIRGSSIWSTGKKPFTSAPEVSPPARPTPGPGPQPTPPPRQRPTPPGSEMPIGGPAPVRGQPGTQPIARTPTQRDIPRFPDLPRNPGQPIGGPAPVRRADNPASSLQRAVNHIRTW